METARVFLAILGLVFGVAGILVASLYDRLTGLVFLVVGAFLLVLPLMTPRSDD